MHLLKTVALSLIAEVLPIFPSLTFAYTWPSPQYDALEELLYEGTNKAGYNIGNLSARCVSRLFDGGPPLAGEWLRLAYHDMATHNITDGTGGLDASIYYEAPRVDNVGAGMLASLTDLRLSSNKYVSHADVIAMAAVWAVASCSGPPIRFRGGRIDANKAGRAGVPKPYEELQSHIESFRLQGFNKTEMISLVACGHALGGVRAADFPTVVADEQTADPSVGFFDTARQYDNSIVAEYLQGKTKNPLVVNSNTTVISDFRIFSSDGNVTMKSMESPAAYFAICQNVLERMINMVPIGVNLTEEIVLLPFKVKTAALLINGSDLLFNVVARVAIPDISHSPSSSAPTVQLFWCDRAGPRADCADGTVNYANVSSTPFPRKASTLSTILDVSLQLYAFYVPISSSASVGKFWFGVRDAGKTDTVLEANGGQGYLIDQDVLVFAPQSTWANTTITTTTFYNMMVGVKSDSIPSLAEVRVYDNSIADIHSPIPPPANFTLNLHPYSSRAPVGGYTFYTANVSDANNRFSVDFVVEVDRRRYDLDFVPNPLFYPLDHTDGGKRSRVGRMSLVNATFGGHVDTNIGDGGNGEITLRN